MSITIQNVCSDAMVLSMPTAMVIAQDHCSDPQLFADLEFTQITNPPNGTQRRYKRKPLDASAPASPAGKRPKTMELIQISLELSFSPGTSSPRKFTSLFSVLRLL